MRRVISLLVSLLFIASPTVALAASQTLELSSPVLIVGNYGAGGTVTALYPSDDSSISATIDWFADSQKIVDSQAKTLFLTSNLIGKTISVKITLFKVGFDKLVIDAVGAKVYQSVATAYGEMSYGEEKVQQPGCFAPRPSGVDSPTVGWQIWFSCQPYNTNFGSPISQKFWWYRNGNLIEGANNISYRLQPADAGQSIWGRYEATFANGFVFTESKKLKAAIPYQLVLPKPTILGSLRVGTSLVARVAGADKSIALSYQWFSDYAPIAGANSAIYNVQAADLGKAVQVLVTGQRDGYSPTTALSAPVADPSVQPVNPMAAYSKIFNGYKQSATSYDINFLTSPNVTAETLAREKKLVQRAADFWTGEYTPSGVTVLYVTKDDATWAEDFIKQQHPSWNNGISGGIRSWIEKNSCGFALAFKADQKQVFIQCVRNGSENSINDQQVGPHEYSHWVQYEQNPALFLGTVSWLIEGQANFYGLALGIAPEDPTLKFINVSLAGHATQYDIYNGYKFADFKMLDILQSGNTFDTQILINRGGTVWDQYAIGTLISEWLVIKYGHQKYVDWMKLLLKTKGQNNDSERAANAIDFKSVFGFEYSQLGIYAGPYLAARSLQLRAAWAESRKNDLTGPTLNTTQLLAGFAGKASDLTDDQRDWISRRVKDGPIQQVVCNVVYLTKTTAKDLALFKSRARNACAFAKTTLVGLGSSATTSLKATKSTKAAEVGKVYLSFKG
jgi:hypothetical protein